MVQYYSDYGWIYRSEPHSPHHDGSRRYILDCLHGCMKCEYIDSTSHRKSILGMTRYSYFCQKSHTLFPGSVQTLQINALLEGNI